jgi:hypothetical protein
MSTTVTPAPDAGTAIERADALAQVHRWIAEASAAGEVEEGVVPDYLAELLDDAERPFKEKIERTGLAALRREQEADAIDVEIKRLAARKATRAREAERIRQYARLCLELAGETKVEGTLCTVAIQRNGGAPAIRWTLAPEQLPEAFRKPPAPPALDTDAARQHLKQHGRLPDGFDVVPPGSSLRIR